MPLDLATLLTLAPVCAPTVAPSTLLAVAQAESGFDPYVIGINGPKPSHLTFNSRSAAADAARRLVSRGQNIDLGLAQINVRNLPRLGLSIDAAFDPCRNLAASAQVLQADFARAAPGAGEEQAGLRAALSYYNTGSPDRGVANGYVAKVIAAASQIVPALAASAPSAKPATTPANLERPGWAVFRRRDRNPHFRPHPLQRSLAMTLSPRAASHAALALTLLAAASPAFAQTTTGVGGGHPTFLQNIPLDLMNSGVVRLVAILAVIGCAAGWMFGRLDLHRMATIVMSIIVIFGAATIVDVITGGSHA